ncbi:MAG: hypothetical protein PW792_08075 [Acidobacteriaceae bacterium]|nr:hypothetical protein [Acidobacteriaceae bacterium]
MKKMLVAGVLLAATVAAAAQKAPQAGQPMSTDGFHVSTPPELKKQSTELLEQAAKSDSGSVSVTLEKYPTHFMMINARTKSGGGELHEHWADIFVVLDGEATVVTGGHLSDETVKGDGEHRGTAVVGGTSVVVHKGDIVQVAAGTPHQTIVAPGKFSVYYVIKIKQ